MNNKNKYKLITISIILISLIIGIILLLFNLEVLPKRSVTSLYKNPDDTELTILNKQVVKSVDYNEFKKDFRIQTIDRGFRESTILTTYTAPNYLDVDEALIGDLIVVRNKFTKWEVVSINTVYVSLVDGDRERAEEQLDELIKSGYKGINSEDEKKIIEQNEDLYESGQLDERYENETNDGRYKFNYVNTPTGDRIEIIGSDKKPETFSTIYAFWHDDNKTLVFVDTNVTSNGDESYSIVTFDAQTGDQKKIFTKSGEKSLLGFISEGNFVAYTSSDEIGIINLVNSEIKAVLNYEKIGLDSDETYIPNIEKYDAKYFIAEIYDKDYLENKKVSVWKLAWDGSEKILEETLTE